jgi:hypothetical protein
MSCRRPGCRCADTGEATPSNATIELGSLMQAHPCEHDEGAHDEHGTANGCCRRENAEEHGAAGTSAVVG